METPEIINPPPTTGGKSFLKKQVQHMFAIVAPELFVKGTTADSKATMQAATVAMEAVTVATAESAAPKVPNANDENKTELAESSGDTTAPFDLILGFMTAVMSKDYGEALRTCASILQHEPKNDLVRQFLPVLEQLNSMSDDDDSSESDNSNEDESSSDSDDSTKSNSDDTESSEEDNALEGGDKSESESDSSDSSEDSTEGQSDTSHSSELGPDPFNTAFIEEEPENVSDSSMSPETMTVSDLVNRNIKNNKIDSPAAESQEPGDL